MRALRPGGGATDAPPSRPEDAPQEQKNKKTFDRQEIHRTVGLCSPCHRHIHTVLDNKELERDYNTIEALKSHPDIQRFVAWIGKKPHGTRRLAVASFKPSGRLEGPLPGPKRRSV